MTFTKCRHNECNKSATFAYEGNTSQYCKTHRLEGMVDVKSKRCLYDGCTKRPSYGFDGNKPVYCVSHYVEGMVNVHCKHCLYDACKKQPSYGFDGNKPVYCALHYVEGMVNVKSKRCEHDNCKKRASFSFKGNKPQYCGLHRLKGMLNTKNKCCQYEECNKQASFALKGNTPVYCGAHRSDEMINVLSKKCKTEGCDTAIKSQLKYRGYCIHCFMHVFPNEKITRNYKNKENEVLNFIIEKFSSCTIVRDRRIQDGCSARRPDVLIDLGDQLIIVEVDENQHKAYDCSCENKRIMQLSQDVGHRNIVFIRFNPDAYIENGVQINSCFSRTKQGFLVIPKSKQAEWNNRLTVLHDTVEYWMKNTTNKTIEVVHLFYDNIM